MNRTIEEIMYLVGGIDPFKNYEIYGKGGLGYVPTSYNMVGGGFEDGEFNLLEPIDIISLSNEELLNTLSENEQIYKVIETRPQYFPDVDIDALKNMILVERDNILNTIEERGIPEETKKERELMTEADKEEKLRMKEEKLTQQLKQKMLKKASDIWSEIYGLSKEKEKERYDEIKNIKKTTKDPYGKEIGYGKAYEIYSALHKDDPNYNRDYAKGFETIKYEPNDYSVYDAYFKSQDTDGNIVENASEDKDFNSPLYKKTAKIMKDFLKLGYDDYEDMKKQYDINKQIFINYGDIDALETMDEIKENAGIKIQISKFEGQKAGNLIEEPLITKDRKLWGIYDVTNDKIKKADMNGGIFIKTLLSDGEYKYEPLKDPKMKLVKSRKIGGKQYYVLDPRYYINNEGETMDENKNSVFIPISKFTKIRNL